MKYLVSNIVYETDGVKVDYLPTTMVVDCEDAFDIADVISDATGWLVESFTSEIIRGGFRFTDTFEYEFNGVYVYPEDGQKLLAHIEGVDNDIIEDMDDDEFHNFLEENGLI